VVRILPGQPKYIIHTKIKCSKIFINLGLIEKIGAGKGIKYILFKNYYGFIDKKEEYTRRKWINKNIQKELLLQYFKDHNKGRVPDFLILFEGRLTRR